MSASSHPLSVPITRLWKMLHAPGMERFELLQRAAQWILCGTILHLHQDQPFEVSYSIRCDPRWHTLSSHIELRGGSCTRALQVEVDRGRWIANGKPQPQLDGCIDIDLGWSPCSNTLPIRRLNLANRADSGPIIAAWVKFPELTLEPLAQEYHRISERLYQYSSRGGAFTAKLLVGEHGLVDEYEGFWKRVTSTSE